jgi:hypothetical protein
MNDEFGPEEMVEVIRSRSLGLDMYMRSNGCGCCSDHVGPDRLVGEWKVERERRMYYLPTDSCRLETCTLLCMRT